MFQIGSFIAKLFLDKNTPYKPASVYTFLSGLVIIIMLMFVVATLLSAIILASLFCLYNKLLLSDTSSFYAFIIAVSVTIAIIALLIMLARHKMLRLQSLVYQEEPITFRISAILSSFVDGLLNQPNQRK